MCVMVVVMCVMVVVMVSVMFAVFVVVVPVSVVSVVVVVMMMMMPVFIFCTHIFHDNTDSGIQPHGSQMRKNKEGRQQTLAKVRDDLSSSGGGFALAATTPTVPQSLEKSGRIHMF